MKLTEEQHAQIDAFIEELSTINDVEWYLDPCGHIRCVLGSGNDVEWYLETCGRIRGALGSVMCPITAVYWKRSGTQLETYDYKTAAVHLGIDAALARLIVEGADFVEAHLSEEQRRLHSSHVRERVELHKRLRTACRLSDSP